ncbi:MAG: hypothetical protein K1X88_22675 [Nannocystaceae bacterium]|nr:hypothetical protein [Nannocystaceae bacterium]
MTRRLAALGLALTSGCADAEPGTLQVRVYGEAFIEQGIAADVFVDGWAITFSRYLVALDGITAADDQDDGRYLFDLTQPTMGAGHEVTVLEVPAGAQALGFTLGPGAQAGGGNASAADRQAMAERGASLWIDGAATKAEQTVAFSWAFTATTRYHDCEVVDEVPAGGSATTTITIHADHIFYDDLESTTPNTAFDLVAAADTDGDATVTEAELRALDITTQARYQVGSHEIENLWDYMTALSQTVGHIDGEGECKT